MRVLAKIRVLTAVCGLFLLCGASSAEGERDGAELVSLSGRVDYKPVRDSQWTPAARGMFIPQGGILRTGEDGRAMLLFPNKTKVWLKELSTLEIEVQKNLASKIAVFAGNVKVRVPHLKWKEIFEVRTDPAVLAVRGTEFVVGADKDGNLDLDVLYGEINLHYSVPPEDGSADVQINQGVRYSVTSEPAGTRQETGVTVVVDEAQRRGTVYKGTTAMLTRSQEVAGIENWDPGLSPAQRVGDLVAKVQQRQDMRNFAGAVDRTQRVVESLTNQVMESDFEAGRTLRDVHGNLVRVDQRLMRPDNSSLQLINLVKRPDYSNSDGHFSYYGSDVSNRLDSFQTWMTFNMNVPQNISDWGSFFTNQNVKVNKMIMVAANQTKNNQIYMTGIVAENKQLSNPNAANELTDNGKMYFGTVDLAGYNAFAQGTAKSDDTSLSPSTNGAVLDANNNDISGLAWAQRPDYEGGWNYRNPTSQDLRAVITWDAPDNIMAGYEATPYCIGANCSVNSKKVWLSADYFVINNSGSPRKVTDFTNSLSNSITQLASATAGEAVIYVKNNVNGAPDNTLGGDTNYAISGGFTNPLKKNIDIVVIPDIAMAMAIKLWPAFKDVKKDSK